MGRHREHMRPKLRQQRLAPVVVPAPSALPRLRTPAIDQISIQLAGISKEGYKRLDQEAEKLSLSQEGISSVSLYVATLQSLLFHAKAQTPKQLRWRDRWDTLTATEAPASVSSEIESLAWKWLRSFCDKRHSGQLSPGSKDVQVVFSAMMQIAALGGVSEVEKVWALMEEQAVQPDQICMNIKLKALCKAGKKQAALEMFTEMRKLKLDARQSSYVCSSLLQLFAKSRDLASVRDAWTYFSIACKGFLDARHYTSLANALLSCGDRDGAKQAVDAMQMLGLAMDHHANAVRLKLARDTDEVLNLWSQLRAAPIAPDTVLWNTYLRQMAYARRPDLALSALEEIRGLGLADPASYDLTIAACISWPNRLAAAEAAFKQAQDAGMASHAVHVAMMGMYASSSNARKAEEVFFTIKQRGWVPPTAAYANMLKMYSRENQLGKLGYWVHKMKRENAESTADSLKLEVRLHSAQQHLTKAHQSFERLKKMVGVPDRGTCRRMLALYKLHNSIKEFHALRRLLVLAKKGVV